MLWRFTNPTTSVLCVCGIVFSLFFSNFKLSCLLLCFTAPWGGVVRPSKCEYLTHCRCMLKQIKIQHNFLYLGTCSTNKQLFQMDTKNPLGQIVTCFLSAQMCMFGLQFCLFINVKDDFKLPFPVGRNSTSLKKHKTTELHLNISNSSSPSGKCL